MITIEDTTTFNYNYGGPVDSSFIDSIYYNSNTQECAVVFDSGRTFVYSDVPLAVAQSVINAISVGRAYDFTLKNRYNAFASTALMDFQEFSNKAEAPTTTEQTEAEPSNFLIIFNILDQECNVNVTASTLSEALAKFNASDITVNSVITD